MQPLNDNVFLKYEKKDKTKKGVVLADTSKLKPATAKVVAVGPGRLDKFGNFVKTEIKKGDTIVVDPFIVQAIKVGDEEYLTCRASEILAKL